MLAVVQVWETAGGVVRLETSRSALLIHDRQLVRDSNRNEGDLANFSRHSSLFLGKGRHNFWLHALSTLEKEKSTWSVTTGAEPFVIFTSNTSVYRLSTHIYPDIINSEAKCWLFLSSSHSSLFCLWNWHNFAAQAEPPSLNVKPVIQDHHIQNILCNSTDIFEFWKSWQTSPHGVLIDFRPLFSLSFISEWSVSLSCGWIFLIALYLLKSCLCISAVQWEMPETLLPASLLTGS